MRTRTDGGREHLVAPFYSVMDGGGYHHGTYQTESEAKGRAARLARTTQHDADYYVCKTMSKVVDQTPPAKFEPVKG